MNRIILLIQVSRPILWPILPMVYFLGMHSANAPMTAVAIVQLLLLTFPMNLVGCGLNDIYDYESDARSSRRRAIWGAAISEHDRPFVRRACEITTPIVLAGALLIAHWPNILATCGLVVMAWAYSVPPVRLKERPPLDSLSNGLGFFLFPFVMGYSLGADVSAMPLRYYLLALCVCGIHALAAAADYDADKAANHRTLAVVFGRRAAGGISFLAFLIALVRGDYQGTSVRAFLAVGTLASLAAVLFPRNRPVAAACATIFVGFLVAAVCHIAGW